MQNLAFIYSKVRLNTQVIGKQTKMDADEIFEWHPFKFYIHACKFSYIGMASQYY
jgi:hypothetical protein